MTSLRELFAGAGDGVAVIDSNSRIIYWNQSAQEILGYAPGEAAGRSCFDVFKGMDERGSIVCGPECSITNCALRGGKIHSFNLLSQRQDGREIWLNLSTMFVADFDSHPDVVVHMFRDIDQLQRAQGLLGEFLSRASELVEPAPSPKRVREEGEDKLTKRERQVLTLLAQGLTAKEIAHHLTISEATARNHIQNILSKLDLHSRLEAALYAIEHGVA